MRQCIVKEIELLSKCDHPNIVKLHEFYDEESRFCIITEYCKGGELFDMILAHGKSFNEKEASRILMQLMLAVSYLHNNKIIHRNIKPENIMLETKNVKVDHRNQQLISKLTGSTPPINCAHNSNLKLIGFGSACSNNDEYLEK